jgi:hypothetical protein
VVAQVGLKPTKALIQSLLVYNLVQDMGERCPAGPSIESMKERRKNELAELC